MYKYKYRLTLAKQIFLSLKSPYDKKKAWCVNEKKKKPGAKTWST